MKIGAHFSPQLFIPEHCYDETVLRPSTYAHGYYQVKNSHQSRFVKANGGRFFNVDTGTVSKVLDDFVNRFCTKKQTLKQIMNDFTKILMKAMPPTLMPTATKAVSKTKKCWEEKGSTSDKEWKKFGEGFEKCFAKKIQGVAPKCSKLDTVWSYLYGIYNTATLTECVKNVKQLEGPVLFKCTKDNTNTFLKWNLYKV